MDERTQQAGLDTGGVVERLQGQVAELTVENQTLRGQVSELAMRVVGLTAARRQLHLCISDNYTRASGVALNR